MIHGIVSSKVEVMRKKERLQESQAEGKLQAKMEPYVTFVAPSSKLDSRMKREAPTVHVLNLDSRT